MKVIYSFYGILENLHSFQTFLFIENIEQQLLRPVVSFTKFIDVISLVIGKKNWVQSKYNQSAINTEP